MVWPPSWRRRIQLQPLAYNAIFHIDVPIHGFPAPPRFRQGKPHAEQQHGQSTFTPTSPAGSCHSHVPSCFAFLCVCALATKHLHYSPASLFTRRAKGWSLASGLTSQPATTDFALSKGAFIFISLLSSAASCLEVIENYPLSLYFPIKCSHLCKMQLYSLYINVNRARIINFSNISHASHTAWVSPTPIMFRKLSPCKPQDCRHQKGLTKTTGFSLPQSYRGGEYNISRYPGHQLNMNKPDIMKHCTEFSYKNTCFSLVLLIRLFSQGMENRITKELDSRQRGSELNSQIWVKIQKNDQQRGSSPLLSSFPPTPKEMLVSCWSAIWAHRISTVVLTDNVIFKALKSAKLDVYNKNHTGTSSPRKAAQ